MAAVAMYTFALGFVPVRDMDTAARWYAHVFGCRFAEIIADGERTIRLYLEEGDESLILVPTTSSPSDTPPIIFTTNAAKANTDLGRKSVITYPIQKDRQGTNFFEIRDCEGNLLEISEMP
jgi:predicted enzyme related to lactoylglutathione lyase